MLSRVFLLACLLACVRSFANCLHTHIHAYIRLRRGHNELEQKRSKWSENHHCCLYCLLDRTSERASSETSNKRKSMCCCSSAAEDSLCSSSSIIVVVVVVTATDSSCCHRRRRLRRRHRHHHSSTTVPSCIFPISEQMMETTRRKDERERGRERKRDEKEKENRKKKNEGNFCMLLLLFLGWFGTISKKIKQPTVPTRSVCVHVCAKSFVLSPPSTNGRYSSVAFWLTSFYNDDYHPYFEHTHIDIHVQV